MSVAWSKQREIIFHRHPDKTYVTDLDPTRPGLKCRATEDGKGDPNKRAYGNQAPRYMFSADGKPLGQRHAHCSEDRAGQEV